jgi:hypothetical protein
MQAVCIALRAVSVQHFPPFHQVALAPVLLDQLDVIAALAVALGALDAENVELALDIAEDEICSGHLAMLSRFPLRETPAQSC